MSSGTSIRAKTVNAQSSSSEANWQSILPLIARTHFLSEKYQHTWRQNILSDTLTTCRGALTILPIHDAPCDPLTCRAASAAAPLEEPLCAEDRCYPCARRYCQLELAEGLVHCFHHQGVPDDIRQAIDLCQAAMDGLCSPHTLWMKAASLLGNALNLRNSLDNDAEAVELAAVLHQEVLTVCTSGHSKHTMALLDMGSTLWRRFEQQGNLDDLHASIEMHEKALTTCVETHPNHTVCLSGLSRGLRMRGNYGGPLDDVKKASQLATRALQTALPGYRDRNVIQVDLAWIHFVLFRASGPTSHLDQAEQLYREALSGDNYQGRRRAREYLPIVYLHRYELYGSVVDLAKALHLYQDALRSVPSEHTVGPAMYNNMGCAYDLHYLAHGKLDDLEESIIIFRKGLESSHDGQHVQDALLNNLSRGLRRRFMILGDHDDIDEAILLIRRAVNHRPKDCPLLLSLTESLRLLFEATDNADIIDEAIQCHKRWQEEDNGYETSILRHHDLASLLYSRYKLNGDIVDLDNAIKSCRQCLELREANHPKRYLTLQLFSELENQLGILLKSPAKHDMALTLAQEALQLLPQSHSERAGCLFLLARLHLIQGASYYSVETAIRHYSDAMNDAGCSPQQRMRAGADILEQLENIHQQVVFDAKSDQRDRLLKCYTLAIRLLPRVAYFGLQAPSRLRVLAKAESLAVDGSAHALHAGRPDLAVELLEEGRTVFWQQHLRLRGQFNQLPDQLSLPLQELSEELDVNTVHPSQVAKDQVNKVANEALSARLRRLGDQFELLVQEARTLPGFERFLMPQAFRFLARAAAMGPVVILIAGRVSGFAVIIESADADARSVPLIGVTSEWLRSLDEVMHVALKNMRHSRRSLLSTSRAMKVYNKDERASKQVLGAHDVLQRLWLKVMGPIISALALKKSTGRKRSRLLLCPTGLFTSLPVHASGLVHSGVAETCSEYCAISLIATLGHAAKQASFRNCRTRKSGLRAVLAAVSCPNNQLWSKLLYAEEEVQTVKEVLIKSKIPTININEDTGDPSQGRTSDDMLRLIPECSILHLACHGYQDPRAPLESGFMMHDKLLTVSMLLALNLSNAFMAFLSACETAKGDRNQPDQAIHLAATMLFAGFTSVVGTMWSMNDVDGPVVARNVYERLLSEEDEYVDSSVIPYALVDATNELRARGVHPARWATYVHFGV